MGKLSALKSALDMSKKARLQRAREQGFDTDTTYYVSTLKDLEKFDRTGKFAGHTGVSGISVTDNPEMASRYLDRFASHGFVDGVPNQPFSKNIMPVYIKKGRSLEVDKSPYASPVPMGHPLPDGYVNPLTVDGFDSMAVPDAISRRGIVKHSNAKNAIRGNEVVLTDPSNIRSINADFDPAKKDSANLLAGTAATAVGTGAMLSGEEADAGPLSSTIKGGKVIGDMLALPGQPSSAKIPGVGEVSIGGNSMIQESARKLSQETGVPLYELEKYLWPDKAYSEAVAREFDLMKHDPSDPRVAAIFDPLEANRTYSVVLGGPLAYEMAGGNVPDFQMPDFAAEQAVPSDYGQLSAEAELLKLTNRERARRVRAFIHRRRARNPQFQALKQAVHAGLEALEMPQQGLMALSRLGYGLATGEQNALQNASQVATQSVEQSAQQFGDYVYDETGSPAAATAGYVAANVLSPI